MRARHLALLVIVCGTSVASGAEFRYLEPGDRGRWTCAEAVAPGWEQPGADESDWLVGPPPPSPTDAGVPPCAVQRQRRRFDVGPELTRLATVTLRVRYADGFVAWLNGVEVARRRLISGSALAVETHGPEPESIHLPMRPGLLLPSGNVLAIEVRPGRPTRNPVADASLVGADGPRIIRGPYLQRVGAGEGWLIVETDLPTLATVEYGKSGGAQRTASAPLDTRHALRFTGLAAATTYHYRLTTRAANTRVADEGSVTVESDFHTPPTSTSQPLRIAVFGDVRSGHEVHAQIVRAVAAEDPDLALLTGDLVDRGTDEAEWQRYFAVAAPLLRQVAVYPAIGNHEYGRKGRGVERFLSLFLRNAPTAWWSFDVAGVHFTLVDSEAYANREQLAWVTADLAEARRRRARAIFVVSHDGPFSSQLHGDNSTSVRDYFPLYERYKVTLAISGHDHDYERGRVGGLDYIVTGGGGAELRTPRCGVPGKRPCGPRTLAFSNEHHYVMLEILRDHLRLCPKRPDGTPLEPCLRLTLRK